MVELKIYLSESLNEKFRKLAMNVFGYGRGSLSKAAEEALTKWCSERGDSLKPSKPEAEDKRVEALQARINPDERQQAAEEQTSTDKVSPRTQPERC